MPGEEIEAKGMGSPPIRRQDDSEGSKKRRSENCNWAP